MNFAFQNRFHYFCFIDKIDVDGTLHIALDLTEAHEYFTVPYQYRNPPIFAKISHYLGAFVPLSDSRPSVFGQPGRLFNFTLDRVESDTLHLISSGVVSGNLGEYIKKIVTERHLILINELVNLNSISDVERMAVFQRIFHLLCCHESSFDITISINNYLLSAKKSGQKFFGKFFELNFLNNSGSDWRFWVRSNYSSDWIDGIYVVEQIAVDIKQQEIDLINRSLTSEEITLVGQVFTSLISTENIYSKYQLFCDKLCYVTKEFIPKQVTSADALRFIAEVTDKLEKIWQRYWDSKLSTVKLAVGTWFMKCAESALVALRCSDSTDGIIDSIRLLSYSEFFPDLTDDFHSRLSELLIISAKADRVSLLLPYFLDNFRYKDHQLKSVCALVNEHFEKIEEIPSGALRVIAALYFYGTTKAYFENGLNTSVFEYDPDYLDIYRKINSGAKNYQSSSIDKLKKILKLGEYNKVLFILFHVHLYLNDESIQGELIRLYTKCHMVVSNGVRWEGIWIFGKTLNDIDLLESFALKLLDVSATRSAEKVISHIKLIEPYSECLTRLQTRLSRGKAIELLKNEGVKFENIQSLSGIEFENLVQSRFEKFQLKVSKTPVSGDFGADLIVDDDDG